MIEGALIFFVAILIDRLVLLRLQTRHLPRPTLEPRCGCGHHAAYHESDTGPCAFILEQSYWELGLKKFKEYHCDCRRFVLNDDIFSALNP